MIRRAPTSTQASAAFLTALFALGLASAQEGNPLDRPRQRPETTDGPAWAGIFVDESEETVFVLVPSEGAADRFEGVLAEQAAGPEGEYVVEGAVREGALEGSIAKQDQRYLFVGRMDHDTLVVTSGATTSRWVRAPGAPREVAELRALLARVRSGREQNKDAGVIGALRTINTAQTLFREADKEADDQLDYGTLEELARAGLVDEELGSGQKAGYRFDVRPSTSTPEFLWMATASPIEPGKPGARHYVTNHAGVVFYSTTAPFTWNDACSIPPDATPVGRPEHDEHDEHDGHGHEQPRSVLPDLSHVRPGQRYTYEMRNAGAPPMQMIYTVREVEGSTVHYEITTIMDLGQGPQPVGPPTPQEWRSEGAGAPRDPSAPPRERLTVSGITFDCQVFESGNTKTWIIMTGDVATFPALLKTATDGKTTMELIKIE